MLTRSRVRSPVCICLWVCDLVLGMLAACDLSISLFDVCVRVYILGFNISLLIYQCLINSITWSSVLLEEFEKGKKMSDLYELVQYAGNIIPRL